MGAIKMNKKISTILFLVTIFFITAFLSLESVIAEDNKDGYVTLTGNVICLYSDPNTENAKPKISSEPCSTDIKHIHFFLETTRGDEKLYSVEGSPEAIERLEKIPERKNIQLTGKISGNPRALILILK